MAALKAYDVVMSWLVIASPVVPHVPAFSQFSYFACCTIKKLSGLSEVKLPDTYSPGVPVVVVKFEVQNSQCKFVPVVERTVKGPLKMTCAGDIDRETVVSVLVTACSTLDVEESGL